MNYSQLGEQLHMTRAGARSLVLRNIDQLKPYLIYKNKKIIGISEESIPIIQNFKMRVSSTDTKKSYEIEKLKLQIDNKNNQIDLLNKMIIDKDNQIDFLKDDNTKLRAILSEYQNLSFFQRLIGYKKKI